MTLLYLALGLVSGWVFAMMWVDYNRTDRERRRDERLRIAEASLDVLSEHLAVVEGEYAAMVRKYGER